MRTLLVLLVCFAWTSVTRSADAISLTDRKLILEVNQAVGQAGKDYAAGEYDQAAKSIRIAMDLINTLGNDSPELVAQLEPAIKRIRKAHTLLEFEGVSLPPFSPPKAKTVAPKMVIKKPVTGIAKPSPTTQPIPTPSNPDPLSFTQSVAPILANRCGRCHISGSKGNFNMATFAALMKGPPEGVVIFPGDNVGSRLIETIETGDMPRGGGKVTDAELKILRGWITAGAKFDGTDPSAPLVSSATTAGPAGAMTNTPIKTTRATGNETISFAKDVAGLLLDNCNGCHIDAMQNRGGLRMDTFAQLLRGGDSGSIIQPGNGNESLLIKKLRGMEGDRMPAGGRPALSESEIQLISTWIDEGATLDGASDRQPLRVMSQLAWAASASPAELSEKRANDADNNLKLVVSNPAAINSATTDHFRVIGTTSKATMELVGKLAEAQMKTVRSVVPAEPGEPFYKGRATIFVLPKRYDYSEFAKMVEQRGVPSNWTSHWKFNGIDAYVALVATEQDEEEAIETRLISPLTALAVATRGGDIPHWFAEGVGAVTASRKAKLDRDQRQRLEAETIESVTAMKDAKSFLGGKMSPKQADRIGAAIATTMLDRTQRRKFDQLLRELSKGSGFDATFTAVFSATPEAFINAWMNYVRR